MQIYYRIQLQKQQISNGQEVGMSSGVIESVNENSQKAVVSNETESLEKIMEGVLGSLNEVKSEATSLKPQDEPLTKKIHQPIDDVPRGLLPAAKSYVKVTQQESKYDETGNSKKKTRIKPLEFRYRGQSSQQPKEMRYQRRITDLEGNTVGEVFTTSKIKKAENYIPVGDTRFIGDVAFDFSYSDSKGYVIRATAYLTEESKDCLANYVTRLLRQESGIDYGREGIRDLKRKVNKSIKKRLEMKRTYEVNIDGIDAHLNLNGKIEIFAVSPELEKMLVDDSGLSIKAKKRFNTNTRYTGYKKWIKETNPDFNVTVGRVFYNLSQVLSKIYERYAV